MKVKGILTEDMVNYKKISLTIMMPYCDFKCERECGLKVCQNSPVANYPTIEIEVNDLVDNYYLNNVLSEAIVFQGLEPFDSWDDLLEFIKAFISKSDDDIVIYTGYTESEIKDKVDILRDLVKDKNTLIVKYGRYIPNQKSHYDEFLGVALASDNQYSIMENRMRPMN